MPPCQHRAPSLFRFRPRPSVHENGVSRHGECQAPAPRPTGLGIATARSLRPDTSRCLARWPSARDRTGSSWSKPARLVEGYRAVTNGSAKDKRYCPRPHRPRKAVRIREPLHLCSQSPHAVAKPACRAVLRIPVARCSFKPPYGPGDSPGTPRGRLRLRATR